MSGMSSKLPYVFNMPHPVQFYLFPSFPPDGVKDTARSPFPYFAFLYPLQSSRKVTLKFFHGMTNPVELI